MGTRPHQVDAIGYPVDPELRRLQGHLGTLAAMWRHAKSMNHPVRQAEIVKEYHQTLATLYALGWNDGLDIDAELPYDLMPQVYFQRAKELGDAEEQRLHASGAFAKLQRLREADPYLAKLVRPAEGEAQE